jgi:hypothetical protein
MLYLLIKNAARSRWLVFAFDAPATLLCRERSRPLVTPQEIPYQQDRRSGAPRICMMESMQIPGILLTTVLGKSYLAHLQQWLAG